MLCKGNVEKKDNKHQFVDLIRFFNGTTFNYRRKKIINFLTNTVC